LINILQIAQCFKKLLISITYCTYYHILSRRSITLCSIKYWY